MRTHIMILASLAAAGILAAPPADHRPDRSAALAVSRSATPARLETPVSVRREHQELHKQLVLAIQAGGKTGEAALRVAELLHPHMLKEEKYALPPLGMLRAFADGEVPADAEQVLALTERFRAEYPRMLEEHEVIVAALGELLVAARAEHHAEIADFAQALMRHAELEEQILYPTTILIGEYTKLMVAKDRTAASTALVPAHR